MRVREAAVAGFFYPVRGLAAEVDGYLSEASSRKLQMPNLKALVGPHAGYKYSGALAGVAYAPVRTISQPISRVVLFSPAHRVPVRGVAATSADFFRSPLGDVAIDRAAVDAALKIPGVAVNDEAHAPEHGVETHLPFLQSVLKDGWTLVPFLVGDAEPGLVDAVLEQLWGGPETLIVISSDLSHFLPYDDACELDAATAQAIVELKPELLGKNSACGRIPLQALLMQSKKRGLKAQKLDVRNSGDTAGSRDQVVGYGAFVFE